MAQKLGVKANTGFSLKDQLFNKRTINHFATHIHAAYPNFDSKGFQKSVLQPFPELGLKQRIEHTTLTLNDFLPRAFNKARKVLLAALPDPLDPSLTDNDFGEFIWVIPGEYIAKYGCDESKLHDALDFLSQSTQRFSAENAIRYFLKAFPAETLSFLTQCTFHENYHVRRLASEGTRPFLPWAPRIELPKKAVFSILDNLHADPTRYVTRSVANALNDYSKITPPSVIKLLKRWKNNKLQCDKELKWMQKHALRTLIKTGHPDALSLIGLTTKPKFHLRDVQISQRVQLGHALHLCAEMTSLTQQRLHIGIRIYFLKASGDYGTKLYKLKQADFEKNVSVKLEKRIPLKPMTTRALYPGVHYASIEINGIEHTKNPFELIA